MKKFTLVLFALLAMLPQGLWADGTITLSDITYSYEETNYTATVIGCTNNNITKITVPSSIENNSTVYTVSTIDANAFNGLSKLTTLVFSAASLPTLNNGFLGDCTTIKTVQFTANSLPTFDSSFLQLFNNGLCISYGGIGYYHQGTWADGYFTVGDGTTGTGYSAYPVANETPRNITILSEICGITVNAIQNNAFNGVYNIDALSIPASILTIPILWDHKISSFSVNNGNPNYCSDNGVLFDKNKTKLLSYPAGSNVTSYTVPNGVTIIGEQAFGKNAVLQSVNLNNSVQTIEKSAFENLSKLYTITGISALTSIGEGAFQSTGTDEGITTYSIDFTDANNLTTIGKSAFQESGLTSVTLPPALQTITEKAFYKCNKLTSITIPSTVTTLGTQAFDNCGALVNLTFSVGTNQKTQLTIVGTAAFRSTALTSVTLPEGITTLRDNAFNPINTLGHIYLPKSTTNIYTDANDPNKNALPSTVTRHRTLNIDFETNMEYVTFCSTEALDPDDDGLKIYTITAIDGTNQTITLSDELDYIPADKPVLLKRTNKNTNLFYGTTPASTPAVVAHDSKFIGTTTAINNFQTVSGYKYVLSDDQFVRTNLGTLPANRCYIAIPNEMVNPADYFNFSAISNGYTFVYKENGVFKKDIPAERVGSASIAVDEEDNTKLKLTVTPDDNHYATLDNIKVYRSVSAGSSRAPSTLNDNEVELEPANASADPSGTTYYRFTPVANATYEVIVDFQKRTNLSDNVSRKINPTPTNYTYDGTVKTQTVTSVTFEDQTITPDNFDVSYNNNTNAGSATITITGKRKCMGTYSESFTIAKRDIKNITVNEKLLEGCAEEQRLTKTFTGSAITLTAEELGISDLKSGSTTEQAITTNDYDVTYENNTNVSTSTQKARINIVSKTGDGVNYTSTKVLYFTIVPKVMTENDITIPAQNYNNGDPVEPKPTIKYGEITLVEGTDYDITYDKNTHAGEAIATFTFKGNYSGTVNKTFIINDHPQTIAVNFENPNNQWTTYYYKENLALVDGLKAYVVTGREGLEVETAEVDFIPNNTAVLLYSESGTKSFNLRTDYSKTLPTGITPKKDLFKGTETDLDISTIEGTKFVLVNGKFIQSKEGTLAANRCYLVVTEDIDVTELTINKAGNAFIYQQDGTETNNIGTASTSEPKDGKVTLTISPKVGYYITSKDDIKVVKNASASSARAQRIDGGSVELTEVEIKDNLEDYTTTYKYTYPYEANCQYQITVNFHKSTNLQESNKQPKIEFAKTTYNGLEQKAEPTVTTYDGIKLTKEVDYVLSYSNDVDYINAGKGKTVQVIGIRKYTKDLPATFEIEKRNVSEIAINAKEGQTWVKDHELDKEDPQVIFTGASIELAITDVIKDAEGKDKSILSDKDITVTYSSDITNVGKKSLTIKGNLNTNYQGERTINYTIVAKEMTSENIAAIPDQKYTGSEIKPALTIKYGDITLTNETDYDVVYSNNINATEEAIATVTFKGNYIGKVEKKFQILDIDETLTINFDSENEWTTYYGTKNLELADNLKAYVVTGHDGKEVKTEEVTFIPKNTAVLLYSKSGKKEFDVKTCSNKKLPEDIKPSNIFRGTTTDVDITTTVGAKFVLVDGKFIQTATGILKANRCYLILSEPIDGVTTLTIGKGISEIITLEEGKETNAVGSARVISTPDENKNLTLVVSPNSGFYADKENLKVVYSVNAGSARAPETDTPEVAGGEVELTPVAGYSDTGKEFKYTFPYTEGYFYQVTVDFQKCINFQTKETQPTITLEEGTYAFDGTEKKPKIASVTIPVNGETMTLTENKDFVVSGYENNINAGGTAKVIINGIGHYTSEFHKNFNIAQRNINLVTVETIKDQIYTGSEITPTIIVKDIVKIDGKDVDLLNQIIDKDGNPIEDYTLEFTNNINVGKANIVINANANAINYTGTKTGTTFNIVPKDLSLTGNKPTIEAIQTQYYTGLPIEPKLTIYDGQLLIPEDNYDVVYSNNINEGEATVNITFKGNYKGTAKTTFKIEFKEENKTLNIDFGQQDEWTTYYSPIDLQKVDGLNIFVVTGRKEQTIELETQQIDYIPKNIGVLLQRTDKTKTSFTGQTMPSKTTLEGVTPDTNLFRGTSTGIEDMKTIDGIKYILVNDRFIQVVEGSLPANRCYVFISNDDAEGINHVEGDDADGIIIQEEGENNKTAGTVTISEVSTDGYKTISVTPASILYATMDEIKVIRSVKNPGQAASRNRAPGIENTLVDIIPVDPTADPSGTTQYKFKYDVNYCYQVTVDFQKRINLSDKNSSNSVVTLKAEDIQNLVYDGKPKTPAVKKVTSNGIEVDPSNYTVTYENNTNAGMPRVIITGKRFFMGSTHAEFSISQRDFSNASIEVNIPDQEYTGSPIEPTIGIVVKDIIIDSDGNETNILREDDYILEYKNNIEIGTATVTVKPAMKNYKGSSRDFTFNIIPATGIDHLTIDEQEGQWYDLNGQRINRPTQKGIYILRDKNKKMKKVRVK